MLSWLLKVASSDKRGLKAKFSAQLSETLSFIKPITSNKSQLHSRMLESHELDARILQSCEMEIDRTVDP